VWAGHISLKDGEDMDIGRILAPVICAMVGINFACLSVPQIDLSARADTTVENLFFCKRGQICPFGLSFPSLFQNRGKFAPNFSPLIYNNMNI
jgi:hypothetical protein